MDSGVALSEQRYGIDFARTRWSMVAAVREGGEIDARDSLRELCRRYWVPVYAYVRRSGHSPEEADRLVQHFLSHLVRRLRIEKTDLGIGFRAYLEAQLAEFLASDAAARTADSEALPEDMESPWPIERIEQRLKVAHAVTQTPSEALHRAFALEMLANALEHLRQEAEEGERVALFDAVRPYLSREPTKEEYAALAAKMDSSQLAAIIAVKRLRQRFQELIDAELAQTVGNPGALASERHTLLTLVLPKAEN